MKNDNTDTLHVLLVSMVASKLVIVIFEEWCWLKGL
jgi:hypothetical protein